MPDAFVTHDPRFREVAGPGARLVRVVAAAAHEGPVYAADEDALYFTTLPQPRGGGEGPLVAIARLALDGLAFPRRAGDVEVVRADANAANGMTLAPDGMLLVCEQGTLRTPARIARVDRATGASEAVVEGFHGLPLNSPNDVVVGPDGAIWFTDPSYGHLQGFRPEPALGSHVYRLDPAGTLAAVADRFDKPNGLALSPDGRTLYVADSGANHEPGSYDPARPHAVRAFAVTAAGTLRDERLLAVVAPGFPDGVKTDAAGRVFVSAADGIHVHDPDGALLGEIRLPGAVNFCFGGPDRDVLFVTADDAIWAAFLTTKGA
jgi:gluconolactonase